eukprot:gene1661-431_t
MSSSVFCFIQNLTIPFIQKYFKHETSHQIDFPVRPVFYSQRNYHNQHLIFNKSLIWKFLSPSIIAFYDSSTNSSKIINFENFINNDFHEQIEHLSLYEFYQSKPDEFYIHWKYFFHHEIEISIYHMTMESTDEKKFLSFFKDSFISNCTSVSCFTAKIKSVTNEKFWDVTAIHQFDDVIYVNGLINNTPDNIKVIDDEKTTFTTIPFSYDSKFVKRFITTEHSVTDLSTKKTIFVDDFIRCISGNGEFIVCENYFEKTMRIYQMIDHQKYTHEIEKSFCTISCSSLGLVMIYSCDFSENSDYLFMLVVMKENKDATKLMIYSMREKRFVCSENIDVGYCEIKCIKNQIVFYHDRKEIEEIWKFQVPCKMKMTPKLVDVKFFF